jgi:serine protease
MMDGPPGAGFIAALVEARRLRKLLRTSQLLVAFAASAAIIAGCGGGQQSSTVIPSQNNPTATNTNGNRTAYVGHRILFYSRTYLKQHPELAKAIGPHARALHSMVTSSNNLNYGGGPVQHTPKIYLIFWGWQSSSDTTADPDGMANYLINYFTALGGSQLGTVQTQYYDNSGSITNPHPEYAGVWYDSTKPPTTYTDSNIQSEASKAVSHFGYSADANYFVVTPHNYTTSGFGSQWCAYHNAFAGSSGNVAYTDFPYVPDAGSGCGQGSVTSPGTLDGASIVGGHEAIETITDPGAGNGWVDSSGSEIGDKCAWTNLQNVSMYGGATFPNQPEWSNAIAGCAYSYGSSTPPPTPSPTPVPTASPSPTPKPTTNPSPTPTPVGGCSGQLLVNPGFESGQTGWSSTSGVINTDGAYSHTGVGYAWLDGYGYTHTDTLSQAVTIKAGCKATLTYWLWIQTQEGNSYPYDTLKLQINGTTKQTFSNINAYTTNAAYAQESLDLSAYAGQTVTIKWVGSEDSSLATSFFIDDTAVNLHT